MKRKYLAGILANEVPNDHQKWINACKAFSDKLKYKVIGLLNDNWLQEVQSNDFDILLAKPGGLTPFFKQLYDERIYILSEILKYKIYPAPIEIFIYENKRFLSFWLKALTIPHPATNVFNSITEAKSYLNKTSYPIIAKTNIGASGSGVKILSNYSEAAIYLKNTFSGKGASQRIGPNFQKRGIILRGFNYILHPSEIIKKYKIYRFRMLNRQKRFVIFQEYIVHDFEWRVVRIGDSFFAHKKLKIGEKASGSLLKNYDNPPLTIFDFVKTITDKFHLYSQAIDIFETKERGYLINEMQCIFGQSDPYQMLVDGKPGRYQYKENKWTFEEGDFNSNESYNLRVQYVLEQLIAK